MNVATDAMDHWKENTCIRFKLRTNETDYVRFTHTTYPSGCFSSVGMIGGLQEIRVGTLCAEKRGSIIHEIGHAIGFWHEHSRPDRDSYIEVLEGHILPGLGDNFQKIPIQSADSLGTPYDYSSIMHYNEYAFSKRGRPTIRVLNPAYRGKVGQRKNLSSMDVKQANLLYGCVLPTPKPTVVPKLTSTIYKGMTLFSFVL
jgi:hypothetical protein